MKRSALATSRKSGYCPIDHGYKPLSPLSFGVAMESEKARERIAAKTSRWKQGVTMEPGSGNLRHIGI